MKIEVPYGKGELKFEVDAGRVIGIITPSEIEPSPNPNLEVEAALKNPIQAPTIEAVCNSETTVAIAVDDNTRVTPTGTLLPPILRGLKRAGAKAENVRIIVALGTHRPMTDREMKAKYGAETVEEYQFLNHTFDDESQLENLGTIAGDVPVWINKEYLKADLRIATGNLVPHCNAGWGGGAKTLLPGLAGEETVGRLHVHSAIATPNALGMENNATRQLIEAFAEKVGLHLIVNTALTRHGEIVKVFAGHFIRAHREGVAFAKRIYAVRASGLSDITIASSYPTDIDYWQGSKALYSADLVTRKGGAIIHATPCPEGISPTHPKLVEYLQCDTGELKKRFEREGSDDLVALSGALELVYLLNSHDVFMVSDGVSERDVEKMKQQKFDDVQEALEVLTRRQGSQSKINILTHGGETYPVLEA